MMFPLLDECDSKHEIRSNYRVAIRDATLLRSINWAAYFTWENSVCDSKNWFLKNLDRISSLELSRNRKFHPYASNHLHEDRMARPLHFEPSSPLAARLAGRIRAARLNLGWTQQVVAGAVGISVVNYSAIETGRRVPGLVRIERLAEVLGVTMTSLFLGSETDEVHAAALVETLKDLPAAEKEFVYRFATHYAQHWRLQHAVAPARSDS